MRVALHAMANAKSAPPVLYSFRRCPYAMRARLALKISGQTCELREVVLGNKPAAMIQASSKGTVPVLCLPNGQIIDESLEVMQWTLSRHDPEQWLGFDDKHHAEMLALINQCDGPFKDALDRYKYPSRYEPCDPLEHRQAGAHFLQTLEEFLDAQPFLSGAKRGLADMAIAPFVRQYAMTDRAWFDAQPWPKLVTWLDDFLQSEPFVEIMIKHKPWTEGQASVLF